VVDDLVSVSSREDEQEQDSQHYRLPKVEVKDDYNFNKAVVVNIEKSIRAEEDPNQNEEDGYVSGQELKDGERNPTFL
jgi:hypothetical protein